MSVERKTLDELANEYGTDKGTAYRGDSRHGYAPIYEKYLAKWRDEYVNMLEVGVCMENTPGGHSIRMWGEYFHRANICTFDIVDMSNHPLIKGSDRVKFFRGDQGVRQDFENMYRTFGSEDFHFIVEDGSHEHIHQVVSLGALFKYVIPDGYYILEDISIPGRPICCANNDETYRMLHKFNETGKMVSEYLTKQEVEYLETHIKSVHIYPDVQNNYCTAIIQKKS